MSGPWWIWTKTDKEQSWQVEIVPGEDTTQFQTWAEVRDWFHKHAEWPMQILIMKCPALPADSVTEKESGSLPAGPIA